MMTIFFGGREEESGPLGWSPETRGVATVLAVLAVTGLAHRGMEALGLLSHSVGWPGSERMVVDGLVGPVRMWLLGGALALLVV